MGSSLRTLLAGAHAGLPRRPLHVGYSGGADSTALLHLLCGIPEVRDAGLGAIHVHHGLHPQADRWAGHCRRFCAALGVPLTLVRTEIRRGGEGLEAAAREARYAAFADAVGDGILVTAHHLDDQAETFLLRALRGSGPDGLTAMRAWRPFARGWLWRPLLGTPRDALLAYARAHALRWIEDESNLDTGLDRNFLRHRVLPLLRERWPRAGVAFARAAALQGEATALLDAQDAHALASVRTADPRTLSAGALLGLPAARRARVLRRWIAVLGLPPLPAQGVARIEADLLHAAPDAEAAFAWAGAVVRRWRDLLHADVHRDPLASGWSVDWDMDAPLVLPTGDTLQLEAGDGRVPGRDTGAVRPAHAPAPDAPPTPFPPQPFRAHARCGGERIVLPGRAHSHALKHVLQDLGVPPWERERLPLLSDAQGRLLAVGDLAYSAGFDAWLRERGARLRWIRAATFVGADPT